MCMYIFFYMYVCITIFIVSILTAYFSESLIIGCPFSQELRNLASHVSARQGLVSRILRQIWVPSLPPSPVGLVWQTQNELADVAKPVFWWLLHVHTPFVVAKFLHVSTKPYSQQNFAKSGLNPKLSRAELDDEKNCFGFILSFSWQKHHGFLGKTYQASVTGFAVHRRERQRQRQRRSWFPIN